MKLRNVFKAMLILVLATILWSTQVQPTTTLVAQVSAHPIAQVLTPATQMSVVERFTDRAAVATAFDVDGASNTFVATLENNGFDAWIMVKKYAPNGQLTWQSRFDPPDVTAPNSSKADSVTLTSSGTTLIVGGTSHETAGTRPYYVVTGRADNIYVPYPEGTKPGSGPNAYTFNADPAPPAPSLTKEEIAVETMNRMRAEFGGNIRSGIQDKARDALTQQGVLTTANYSNTLYQWYMDRQFEALRKHVFGVPGQGYDVQTQMFDDHMKALIRQVLAEPR